MSSTEKIKVGLQATFGFIFGALLAPWILILPLKLFFSYFDWAYNVIFH